MNEINEGFQGKESQLGSSMSGNKLPHRFFGTSSNPHRISNREAFSEALTQVNALVRREDISIPEAKELLTKAEALRAWAFFDKRLSDDERKEANRAMTRTILLLARIAEQEQPPFLHIKGAKGKGKARQPGPVVWLRRECGMTPAKATYARRLFHNDERVREILDLGVHWLTGISNGEARGEVKNTVLNRMRQWVGVNNSLWVAAKIAPNMITRELARIRNIKAWCEAYEAALIQRKSRETFSELPETTKP